MKQHIRTLLNHALKLLAQKKLLTTAKGITILVEETKDDTHGDFASNIALVLAKTNKTNPRALALQILEVLPPSASIQKVEIAGPGFINFFMTPAGLQSIIPRILKEKEQFGRCKIGRQKTVLVEFVSSNPTGPLHVGHGRHAVFGDVVCRLLCAIGFKVTSEYYVNDAGRQMDILALSIWLRYLQQCGKTVPFPQNGYQGTYVTEIAEALKNKHGETLHLPLPTLSITADDPEKYIDTMIAAAKKALGPQYSVLSQAGLASILADIENDLTEFGVRFDRWFSEQQFVMSGAVDKILEKLKVNEYVYEKEGAIWFRSTQFGDEKDRVLIRANGEHTYFANDIGYHLNKF